MTAKRWALLTLSLILSALLLCVALVAWIDPFEVYHKATRFIPPIASGTQSYSNAGIAKSYDYDSIVIGSSMTENFRPSQLDSLLGRPVCQALRQRRHALQSPPDDDHGL